MYISRRSKRYQNCFEKLFKVAKKIEESHEAEDIYRDAKLLEQLSITAFITNNYINLNAKKGTPIKDDLRNIKVIIITAFIIADKLLNDLHILPTDILKYSYKTGFIDIDDRISRIEFEDMEKKLLDYISYCGILRINVGDGITNPELDPLLNLKYLKEEEQNR